MATGHSPEPSSQGDPFAELEPVLVDMTKDLIPGYVIDIQKTKPSELDATLSLITTTALVTPLKGQTLTEMLGKMAVVMAAERRALEQILESTHQALAKAERDISELKARPNTSQGDADGATSKDEENAELQGKNAELVSRSRDTRPPLKQLSNIYAQQPPPMVGAHFAQGPSDRDLDKIARNITRFEPNLGGSHHTNLYLRDIDFYLWKFPNASVNDKIYLIKVTSSRDVSAFIDRQPDYIRTDYSLLCKALLEEFSDYLSQTGLTSAMIVKQGRNESPQQYYHHLRLTYFGSKNEPGMEEDLHFKAIFIQDLHPTTRPGQTEKPPPPKPAHQSNGYSRPPWSSQNQKPKFKGNYRFPNYGSDKFSPNQRENRPARDHRESDRHNVQNTYLQDKQPPKQDPSEEKAKKDKDSRGKPTKVDLSEEELDAIRRIIQNMRREKKADLFSVTSACSEPSPQAILTRSPEAEAEENYLDPCEPEPALLSNRVTTVQSNSPEQNLSQLTPPSAVLVVQLDSKDDSSKKNSLTIQGEPPFQQFLCHLTEKGDARKFYLSMTLENELHEVHEALLDTAADITLMSATLFNTLRAIAHRSNKELKLQTCSLKVQPYGLHSTTLKVMTLVQLTIGPMTLVHPVYVSSLDTIPLLVGKDLLNRFKPLIDFKRLNIRFVNLCLSPFLNVVQLSAVFLTSSQCHSRP
ncbi:hypothetical protein ABVT39_022583 [Epinephelus coioides]